MILILNYFAVNSYTRARWRPENRGRRLHEVRLFENCNASYGAGGLNCPRRTSDSNNEWGWGYKMALWLLFSKYNLKFNPKLETLITSLNIVVILHCSMLHMIDQLMFNRIPTSSTWFKLFPGWQRWVETGFAIPVSNCCMYNEMLFVCRVDIQTQFHFSFVRIILLSSDSPSLIVMFWLRD